MTVRTADCLHVQGQNKDEYCENLLQIGAQRVRKNNNDSQNGLPQQDDRFPEDVLLPVRSVKETGNVVDPSLFVVFFDVANSDVTNDGGKAKSEDDQERPSQDTRQHCMGSLVALDRGVDRPVIRRVVDADGDRVVDSDAAEDVDERFAQRDVADVEDDEGTQDNLLQQIDPCLLVAGLDHEPEDGVDEDGGEGLEDVDQSASDGAFDRGSRRNDAVHGSIDRFGRDAADKLCREDNAVIDSLEPR